MLKVCITPFNYFFRLNTLALNVKGELAATSVTPFFFMAE